MTEQKADKTHRWVIKIGSALLTNDGRGLDQTLMQAWVDRMVALRRDGVEIILVSSGAVAEGMTRLGWKQRPDTVHELQAAAVGQMGLIQAWESCFQQHGLHTAQVLLTHDDLSDRKRYLNARSTLMTLLDLAVVPVVNENDTVVTDEIRFGDNDTLAALVANLVVADRLVILTDQDGLYEKDPRKHPDAGLIDRARASDPALLDMAGGGSGALGRGGMTTKVRAGALAARSGALTTIASGRRPELLAELAGGGSPGTTLEPDVSPFTARKQWLAGHLQMKGRVIIDEGAARRLRESGSSLLPVGVTAVEGQFSRGDMVACEDEKGERVACGLVNYDADDARKILRCKSGEIAERLGFVNDEELIHRDNMVVF